MTRPPARRFRTAEWELTLLEHGRVDVEAEPAYHFRRLMALAFVLMFLAAVLLGAALAGNRLLGVVAGVGLLLLPVPIVHRVTALSAPSPAIAVDADGVRLTGSPRLTLTWDDVLDAGARRLSWRRPRHRPGYLVVARAPRGRLGRTRRRVVVRSDCGAPGAEVALWLLELSRRTVAPAPPRLLLHPSPAGDVLSSAGSGRYVPVDALGLDPRLVGDLRTWNELVVTTLGGHDGAAHDHPAWPEVADAGRALAGRLEQALGPDHEVWWIDDDPVDG